MKIKSARLTWLHGVCGCMNSTGCESRQSRCRPGRWYDEKTARLMERAVKILVDDHYYTAACQPNWLRAWAKLTEKKTGN